MKGSLWILPNVRSLEPSLPARDILTTVEMRYVTVSFFLFSDNQSERDADIYRGEVSLQRYAKLIFLFIIYRECITT